MSDDDHSREFFDPIRERTARGGYRTDREGLAEFFKAAEQAEQPEEKQQDQGAKK